MQLARRASSNISRDAIASTMRWSSMKAAIAVKLRGTCSLPTALPAKPDVREPAVRANPASDAKPPNLAILQSACIELRDYLDRIRRSIDEEIRSYPTPIPRC